MDEVLVQRIEKLKDRYDRSIVLGFIAILVFFFLHVTTVNKFISIGKKAAGAKTELVQLTAGKEIMKNINEKLADFRKNTEHTIKGLLGNLVNKELVPAFEGLDASVKPHIRHLLEDDPLARLRRDRANEADRAGWSMALQARQPEDEAPARQVPSIPSVQSDERAYQIPNQQINELKKADNINEVRKILQPIVKSQIIDQKFDDLNREWKKKISKMVGELKNDVNTSINQGQSAYESGKPLWEETTQNLGTIAEEVEAISFPIPADDGWWWSVEGKGVESDKIFKASKSLVADIYAESDPARLIENIEKKKMAQEQLIKKLDEREESIRKQFEEQVAALQGLKFVALDLGAVVLHFPIFLGIGLGVLVVWTAYRRSELVQAISFVENQNTLFSRIRELFLWDTVKTAHNTYVRAAAILTSFSWLVIATFQLASEGVFCMEMGAVDSGLQSADCSTWGKAAVTFLIGAACLFLGFFGGRFLESRIDTTLFKGNRQRIPSSHMGEGSN